MAPATGTSRSNGSNAAERVWKHGGKWEGIIPQLLTSFKKTAAGPRRLQLEKYMRVVPLRHLRRQAAQRPGSRGHRGGQDAG